MRFALSLPGEALMAPGEALSSFFDAGFEGVVAPVGPGLPGLDAPLLARHGIALAGAHLAAGLTDGQGVAGMLNAVNPLLDGLVVLGCPTLLVSEPPVADRVRLAGRVHEAGARALRDEEWANLASALDELGARCAARGMALAFVPRAGTWVETPVEIKRLMNMTEPTLVGLGLDTGHAAFGGGSAAQAVETWRWRLRHVALQTLDTAVLDTAVRHGLPLDEAERRGVFRLPLEGDRPVQEVLEALRAIEYAGWVCLGPAPAPEARRSREAVAGWLERVPEGA